MYVGVITWQQALGVLGYFVWFSAMLAAGLALTLVFMALTGVSLELFEWFCKRLPVLGLVVRTSLLRGAVDADSHLRSGGRGARRAGHGRLRMGESWHVRGRAAVLLLVPACVPPRRARPTHLATVSAEEVFAGPSGQSRAERSRGHRVRGSRRTTPAVNRDYRGRAVTPSDSSGPATRSDVLHDISPITNVVLDHRPRPKGPIKP